MPALWNWWQFNINLCSVPPGDNAISCMTHGARNVGEGSWLCENTADALASATFESAKPLGKSSLRNCDVARINLAPLTAQETFLHGLGQLAPLNPKKI